ncbi:hypothetical protein HDU67_004466 [Dinochytrium kinnereticum]|nr:hypothetical protein HDU67_004466 [Dinochytrium kinnereticum]
MKNWKRKLIEEQQRKHICITRFLETMLPLDLSIKGWATDPDAPCKDVNGVRAWRSWVTAMDRISDPELRVTLMGTHRLRHLASLLIFPRRHGPNSTKTLSSLLEPHPVLLTEVGEKRCQFKDSLMMLDDVKLASRATAIATGRGPHASTSLVNLINDRYLGIMARSSIIVSASKTEAVSNWDSIMRDLKSREEEIALINGIVGGKLHFAFSTGFHLQHLKSQISPPLVVCSALLAALDMTGNSTDINSMSRYLREMLYVPQLRLDAASCIALSCAGRLDEAARVASRLFTCDDGSSTHSLLHLHWNRGYNDYGKSPRPNPQLQESDPRYSDERVLGLKVLIRCLGQKGHGLQAATIVKSILSENSHHHNIIGNDVHESVIHALIRSEGPETPSFSSSSAEASVSHSSLKASEDYISFLSKLPRHPSRDRYLSQNVQQMMVEGYSRLGDLSSAERWHRHMLDQGLNLDEWGYRALADAMMQSAVAGWCFGKPHGVGVSLKGPPSPPISSSAPLPPILSLTFSGTTGTGDDISSMALRAPLGPRDVCDHILSMARQANLGPPFPISLLNVLARGLFLSGDYQRALELCHVSNRSIQWILRRHGRQSQLPHYVVNDVIEILRKDLELALTVAQGLATNRYMNVAKNVVEIISERRKSPVLESIRMRLTTIGSSSSIGSGDLRKPSLEDQTAEEFSPVAKLRSLLSESRLRDAIAFYATFKNVHLPSNKFFINAPDSPSNSGNLFDNMTATLITGLCSRGMMKSAISLLTDFLKNSPDLSRPTLCSRITPIIDGFSRTGDIASALNVFRYALVVASKANAEEYASDVRLMKALYSGFVFKAGRTALLGSQRGRYPLEASHGVDQKARKVVTRGVVKEIASSKVTWDVRRTPSAEDGRLPLDPVEKPRASRVSSSPRLAFFTALTNTLQKVPHTPALAQKITSDAYSGCILYHAQLNEREAADRCFADALSTEGLDPLALAELRRMYLRAGYRGEGWNIVEGELARSRVGSLENLGPVAVVGEEVPLTRVSTGGGRVLLPSDRERERGGW